MSQKRHVYWYLVTVFVVTLLIIGKQTQARDYYWGADLSYVNEMEDCGAIYRVQGKPDDPFHIFATAGTNFVRIRIWNNPTWTKYSSLKDAERSLQRAHAQGLKTLLDFHYSDDWADGDKQLAPAAWAALSTDEQVKALYQFTFDTLSALNRDGLMPDMVQVGNETNHEIVSSLEGAKQPIHWDRNARLFNAGIQAVHDVSRDSAVKPKIMLHIAQPENIEWWFEQATAAGVTDFDVIGISYYKRWSKLDLDGLGEVIRRATLRFHKDVVVVETAYPFTNDNADTSPNLMDENSSFPAYGVSLAGQAHYLHDLMQTVLDHGGVGVVYWEPAWVSTHCSTRWGVGSNWDNATFFDFDGNALPALEWPKQSYVMPVETTLRIQYRSAKELFVAANLLGGGGVPMERDGDQFVIRFWARPGASLIFGVSDSREGLNTAEALQLTIPDHSSTVQLDRTPYP